MPQGGHSAILSTFIELPYVIKIFDWSIFEWPFIQVLPYLKMKFLEKVEINGRRQRSGIDTIKYHTQPKTPYGKVTKHKKNITDKSQRVSSFLEGDHEAAWNRQDSIIKTHKKLK